MLATWKLVQFQAIQLSSFPPTIFRTFHPRPRPSFHRVSPTTRATARHLDRAGRLGLRLAVGQLMEASERNLFGGETINIGEKNWAYTMGNTQVTQ